MRPRYSISPFARPRARSPLRYISARGYFEEQRGVELLRHPVRLDQPRALAERHTTRARPAALLVVQLDAELGGEPLDRLGEGEVLDLLHERDDVAALAAAEAVVAADGGTHGEARRLLVVEGAQPLQAAHSGRA